LWLGTTLPSGEVAIMMEDPTGGGPAVWERAWREAVPKTIADHAV
jgi:hypothetical protein